MASHQEVVVSGASIIAFPNFIGKHVGGVYQATASPDQVSQDSFVFGPEAVVVFTFSKLTTTKDSQNGFRAHEDEVSGHSRLIGLTYYTSGADYLAGKPAVQYRPLNPDGTNLSNSLDRYGDTYLGFQTNAFASAERPPLRLNGYEGPIPRLGAELFIMPGVDLYQTLVVNRQGFTYGNVSSQDLNGDGIITAGSAEVGNGFFNAGHSNILVEQQIKEQAPICFCRGTLITTRRGEVAVEDLAVGDEILTADHGWQPLRWISHRAVSVAAQQANDALRPVLIRQGALGQGLPVRDLMVSQQHRVLVRSAVVRRMTGFDEILVAAKHLMDDDQILRAPSCRPVDYYHLLLDAHEVIYSNGAATESLYLGETAMALLPAEARAEIMAQFPDLVSRACPVRFLPSGRIGRRLRERHAKNRIPHCTPGVKPV